MYPKQGDCAKFIYCPSGLVFDCPPLTSFNPEKGICDYIENFKCGVKTKENGKKNGKGSQRNANTSSKKEGNVDNKSGNTEIHKNNNKKHRENVDQLKNVKNEKGISKFHNNKSGKKSKKTKENIERQKNLDKNKNEIELQKNKERIKNRKMQIKVKKQKKVDFRNSKIALRRNENNRKNEKMLGNRDKQEVVGNKIGNIQIHNKAKSRKSKRLQGKSKPGEQLKVENNVSKVTKSGKNSKKGGTPGSSARVRSNNKNIDLHIRKPKDEGEFQRSKPFILCLCFPTSSIWAILFSLYCLSILLTRLFLKALSNI